MNLIVNLTGLVLIGFTYWFFLMKKESQAVSVEDEVTIVVDGGYKPDVITVKKGTPVTLKFHRKDESSCLEDVIIPDFKIREHLSLNKVTEIIINPNKTGEFSFTCGMNMFHGKIKVEE